jgi:hypothetical protein
LVSSKSSDELLLWYITANVINLLPFKTNVSMLIYFNIFVNSPFSIIQHLPFQDLMHMLDSCIWRTPILIQFCWLSYQSYRLM